MFREHVTDSASSNTEEGRPREPIQEPGDQHSLDVIRKCARKHPDQEECKGA